MSAADPGDPAPREAVVIHYHLFKNAGTSVDRLLKAYFKDTWANHEGHPMLWPAHEVADWLAARPAVRVLSSHTASLPAPLIAGARVHPIIFVRHPIDRVRSMYEFEVQQTDKTAGSELAKTTDLAGYVRWRLERKGDRALRDFQALRLAHGSWRVGTERERALDAAQTLPFVGVVEEFDRSIAWLERLLRQDFPGFTGKRVKVNTTQREGEGLEERLARTRQALGDTLADALEAANANDLALYEAALKRLQRESEPAVEALA